MLGGLGVSREQVDGEEDNETNVDAFGTVEWNLFRFDDPELDLISSLTVTPVLSDLGRVRGDFDLTLAWELYKDIDWEVTLFATYDSDPIVADAPKEDWGIVTGVSVDL